MNRGQFIVFEGVDGSGKSTQVKFLSNYFHNKGLPVVICRFPNRTTATGKLIDDYLQGRQKFDARTLHLLFSANRWEMQEEIRSILNQGINIICDRYKYSGMLYSLARGLPLSWAQSSDEGLIEPDLTFWLDVHPKVCAERMNRPNLETDESLEFQKQVYRFFENCYVVRPNHMSIIKDSTTENMQAEIIRLVE